MIKGPVIMSLFIMTFLVTRAGQFYVHYKTGNDANPGTKLQPLRTVREASFRVNFGTAQGGDTIILSEGVHLLTETVLFSNSKYTQENRLIIRAEIMPGDPSWVPQSMPIIVTVVPTKATPYHDEEARG